jgi:tRNA A37 methylthiotransferase MiaB
LGYDDYYVLIAQGCSNRCSYCNINRSKGPVRSEPPEIIEAEIAAGLARGARQFALLADDCGSYGHDCGSDLARLMERLFAIGDDFTLKLGYLYPGFLVNHFDAVERLFATGRISFANIPVQSGSQRLLDLMNRRYPIATVLEMVRRLRAAAPSSRLCTHLLMNFPTETRGDFFQTMAAAEHFGEALFLHYSDNEGTAAAALVPKVPADEARRRWDLASEFANSRMPGRAFVIVDFNCGDAYNVARAGGR